MNKREKETTLLPCPFCEGEVTRDDSSLSNNWINCQCGAAQTDSVWNDAVLAWNRRPADSLQERVKVLEVTLGELLHSNEAVMTDFRSEPLEMTVAKVARHQAALVTAREALIEQGEQE